MVTFYRTFSTCKHNRSPVNPSASAHCPLCTALTSFSLCTDNQTWTKHSCEVMHSFQSSLMRSFVQFLLLRIHQHINKNKYFPTCYLLNSQWNRSSLRPPKYYRAISLMFTRNTLSWKGPTRIPNANCWSHTGQPQSEATHPRASSKGFSNPVWLGATAPSLGSLVRARPPPPAKSCFPTANVHFPRCSFRSIPCVLSPGTREERCAPPFPLPPPQGGVQAGSPLRTKAVASAAPPNSCPRVLSLPLLPSFGLHSCVLNEETRVSPKRGISNILTVRTEGVPYEDTCP